MDSQKNKNSDLNKLLGENSNLSTINGDEKSVYQNYFKHSKPRSRINLNS